MATETKIGWTDATFNPWIGCSKVSPGCLNCYAEKLNERHSWAEWGPDGKRHRTGPDTWKIPAKLNRYSAERVLVECLSCGWRGRIRGHCPNCNTDNRSMTFTRPRLFVASLADWLEESIAINWFCDLLDVIYRCPHVDFQMLTKRPENFYPRMQEAFAEIAECDWPDDEESGLYSWLAKWLEAEPPANVWFGVSVEDVPRKSRIEWLRNTPARIRFLSCEPLLADLGYIDMSDKIDWVIVGGESGKGARPMNINWAYSLQDQCNQEGVPFFMKQIGGEYNKNDKLEQFPPALRVREFPNGKG